MCPGPRYLLPVAVFLSLALSPPTGTTVATRFAPPVGAVREALPSGSFGATLRNHPLLPPNSPVHLHHGGPKGRQDVHAAVLDLSVGTRDLQQCADAVMRLRAEHLFAQGDHSAIRFNFTNGFVAIWDRWRAGDRIVVEGNRCHWVRKAAPDSSHAQLLRYMDMVFTYAGTLSLAKELKTATGPIAVGDVFIQGGSPGHAVVVMDLASSADGDQYFLLAQSYMPAQQMHILLRPDGKGAWYRNGEGTRLATPEWVFDWSDRKRW